VRFSLENSPDGLGLGYTGLAMTLIAVSVSVLVPRSASPLRSCPQLMRRPRTAPASAQRRGLGGVGLSAACQGLQGEVEGGGGDGGQAAGVQVGYAGLLDERLGQRAFTGPAGGGDVVSLAGQGDFAAVGPERRSCWWPRRGCGPGPVSGRCRWSPAPGISRRRWCPGPGSVFSQWATARPGGPRGTCRGMPTGRPSRRPGAGRPGVRPGRRRSGRTRNPGPAGSSRAPVRTAGW
jgi:hypothetical protein